MSTIKKIEDIISHFLSNSQIKEVRKLGCVLVQFQVFGGREVLVCNTLGD